MKPLLAEQLKTTFLPQSVPAYAATEQFNDLHKSYSDYSYKEATLNPSDPRDRASDWEADVVQTFRNTPETTEIVGERDTPTGRELYLARPIQIKSAACLECHNTVDVAPKTMLNIYGNANGFGWHMNEIIGAQVVSVAMTVPVERPCLPRRAAGSGIGGWCPRACRRHAAQRRAGRSQSAAHTELG